MRSVLWIDDKSTELEAARRMLASLPGMKMTLLTARSSEEAAEILLDASKEIHVVVTDILRRPLDGKPSTDDGYEFFRERIRRDWPTLPVVFHTKNLPGSFETDEYSQYLSKWDSETFKAAELERRLSDIEVIYDRFADEGTWAKIQPRLIEVSSHILQQLPDYETVTRLTPFELEQLVAELLDKIGYSVLWIPGGRDGGVDIVASAPGLDWLIDVKQYAPQNPVGVEMVRQIYGISNNVAPDRPGNKVHGGIITTSRFTRDAESFRNSSRPRPLLRDSRWLRDQLSIYAPRLTLGSTGVGA